jgi:hypothetical protein
MDRLTLILEGILGEDEDMKRNDNVEKEGHVFATFPEIRRDTREIIMVECGIDITEKRISL